MSYKCGIVGLPNVGKSALFNILTRSNIARSENFPFCTIDPNIANFIFKDEHLINLHKISKSKKAVFSHIELVDIAGLVKDASEGEGLGNEFLSHVRSVDCILHVVRCFEDSNIIHVMENVDPIRDLEVIQLELIRADLSYLEKSLNKVKKPEEKKYIENLKIQLEKGEIPSSYEENLLCTKPFIVLINGDNTEQMEQYCQNKKYSFIKINSQFMNENEINNIAEKVFEKLNLICYFTTGEMETRAWRIESGTNAVNAAGKIHTDFTKKFVKAHVVAYDDYIKDPKSPKKHIAGRDYIVKLRDVIEFLISK